MSALYSQTECEDSYFIYPVSAEDENTRLY